MATKKKVVKKRVAAPRTARHEIVVKVQAQGPVPTTSELALPMVEQSKYMLPKTWMSEKQVLRIIQSTDPKHVYRRKGKGGRTFDYVTTQYVTKVLNFVFGWNWDFEVVQHGKEGKLVWVLGKLTVKDDAGHTIVKTQFGRAEIKKLQNSDVDVDFGNDLKAAASDALKKCASMLGIASDVYGKTEYQRETGVDVRDDSAPAAAPQGPKPGQVKGPDGGWTYVCGKDDQPITEQEAQYSKKVFGKHLCRDCQKTAQPIKR